MPNFVKSSKKLSSKEQKALGKEMHAAAVKKMSLAHLQHPNSMQSLHQMHSLHPHQQMMAAHHHQQMMWHARSYESGIGIYGQLASYATKNNQSMDGLDSCVHRMCAGTLRRISSGCSNSNATDRYDPSSCAHALDTLQLTQGSEQEFDTEKTSNHDNDHVKLTRQDDSLTTLTQELVVDKNGCGENLVTKNDFDRKDLDIQLQTLTNQRPNHGMTNWTRSKCSPKCESLEDEGSVELADPNRPVTNNEPFTTLPSTTTTPNATDNYHDYVTLASPSTTTENPIATSTSTAANPTTSVTKSIQQPIVVPIARNDALLAGMPHSDSAQTELAPAVDYAQPLSLTMHPQQTTTQPCQHHPLLQQHPHQMCPASHLIPPTALYLQHHPPMAGGGTVLQVPPALSPVYVQQLAPTNRNNRKLSRGQRHPENERKIYEPMYGFQRDGGASYGHNGVVRQQPRQNQESNGNQELERSQNELENWTMEPFGMYGHFQPKYVSAMNLQESAADNVKLQYQYNQHLMPSHYDYFYIGRPAPNVVQPQSFCPGASHHGKWASDQDIYGTLERMKKGRPNGGAHPGRKGEFRFDPAIFNGQMFRNANMRYSTESMSEDGGALDNGLEQTGYPAQVNGESVESSLGPDNSALVNFMRANNGIVNQDIHEEEPYGNRQQVTRTTNIRYVTKVYVPRKLQKGLKETDPKNGADGRGKKSVSSESFFNDFDEIKLDDEDYERERIRIEEHLEMLKEHSIMDYDSHDRKRLLTRSQSHNNAAVPDEGSKAGGASKQSKVPVARRMSMIVRADVEAVGKKNSVANDLESQGTNTEKLAATKAP